MPQVGGRQSIVVDFNPPEVAQAGPSGAPAPLAELAPGGNANMPQLVATPAERHIASCQAMGIDFSKIEDYATGKTGIGFLGWRFWSNKAQTKKYLEQQLGKEGLKAVLEKMPWNASRSLSVLCLLVKSGLPAASVGEIFKNKNVTKDDAKFEMRNLPDSISTDVIEQLARCRTTTFLKKIANSVVATKLDSLGQIMKCAPDRQQREAAALQILALAAKPAIQSSQDPAVQSILIGSLGNLLQHLAALDGRWPLPLQQQKQKAALQILALAAKPAISTSTDPNVQNNLLAALVQVIIGSAPDQGQNQEATAVILALAREGAINHGIQQRVLLDTLDSVAQYVPLQEQQREAARQIRAQLLAGR